MSGPRMTLFALLAAGAAAAVWWLFGISTTHELGGTLTSYRYFGRVVRFDTDWNSDGIVDQSWRFTWSVPMQHHTPPQAVLSDHDSDGRWDLWVFPGGTDAQGYELARFRVDTNRDGVPDWTFVDHWQSQRTYAKIRARRGF